MKVRIIMRKHCARKWLHFIIDLLPFVVIPIFAIWQINHNGNQPITVTEENKEVVNFNQYLDIDSAEYTVESNQYRRFLSVQVYRNSQKDYYILKGYAYGDYSTLHINVQSAGGVNSPQINYTYTDGYFETRFFATNGVSVLNFFAFGADDGAVITCSDLQLFDLTVMYGSGNEPSLADFNASFTNPYYQYNTGTKMLINNGTVTYDNTDIGSQFLYAVYKPVQQYFNFDNIFNFGALRNWFELNFFNGNMGIPMTIIWNVIIYEFLSDIIMLIYTFFMFIIDFANDLLERPFSDIKRG